LILKYIKSLITFISNVWYQSVHFCCFFRKLPDFFSLCRIIFEPSGGHSTMGQMAGSKWQSAGDS